MVIRVEGGGNYPFCFDLMQISSAMAQALTPRLMRLATTRGYPIWRGDRMCFGVFQACRYKRFESPLSRQAQVEILSEQSCATAEVPQARNNFEQLICDNSIDIPSPQTV